MVKHVLVAGAGASGLMAAITAARSGAKVTLLEAMDRPGRKLLVTGNGRCNLTNLDPKLASAYHGADPAFAKSVIDQFPPEKTLDFFHGLGLLTTDRGGYVYPYTNQASSVLEVLLSEVRRLKIKVKLSEKIERIFRKEEQWKVQTATWTYSCDSLILCCGSKCMPQTGSDGSGYVLAASAGLSVHTPSPALTPLLGEGKFLSSLAGVRCHAHVTLLCSHHTTEKRTADSAQSARYDKKAKNTLSAPISSSKAAFLSSSRVIGAEKHNAAYRKETVWETVASECGELQWTKYGISGIAVFQLSRHVSCASKNERFAAELDLLDPYSDDEVLYVLRTRAQALSQEKISVLLRGLLPEKLIPVIQEKAGIPAKMTCAALDEKSLVALLHTCRAFRLTITGTKDFDTCQVCAGGVDPSALFPETMECRSVPGLYFAGELLDVDGPCGGYNLQWAWSSGYVAGHHAAV